MDELNPSNKGEDRLSDESPWPSSSPSASSSAPGGWRPSQLVFHPYSPLQETAPKSAALRVFVRKPLVARLTKDIVETYQICNPQFKYSEELNRKRYLTSPADGVLNGGHDNANSDLILTVNYVLVNSQRQQRYIVKDILGQGTFGQVAKCWVPEVNNFVAVKIIKNQPAYYQQALVEVSILTTLNNRFDPEDKHHIIRIYDYFVFQRHLCISFELLGTNLYELIKLNNFRGLSLSIVQLFSKQILRGLALMKEAGIIHCDLKPENILLCTSMKPAEIKIIDFGSACVEEHTVYSYIQSRYYRSPEVLLGYQYTTAIDMWSFGCIVAELFLGLPLFPGASEFDLLKRMIRILGGQPPDYLLKEAKNTSKFFKYVGIADRADAQDIKFGGNSAYRPFTEEEYEARENKKPIIGKEYFNYMDLEAIVAAYPCRKNLPEEDVIKERQVRLALIDFLRGLVEFDPAKRWSPFQASKHPFVTGEPFTCPYKPPPETPHMPVMQSFKVEHHPGGGHWFVAGLSPNVSGRNIPIHASPRFQMVPYAHGSSYGSLGSHGSYNDCNGLGSSYGSYGDNLGTFAYFSPAGPSGMNIHTQGGMTMFQSSPDTRWRMIHRPPGLGASPSAGNVVPLPLGTSPSQFTPPNTFSHVSGSPGQYGSVSPAWGNSQGSPLGKGEAVSHFSRRRSWGYSGSMPSQDGASSSYRRGQFNESNPQMPGGPPLHMPSSSNVGSWKQPQESVSSSIEYSPFRSMPSFFMHGSGLKGASSDKLDTHLSLPDPGDWDPNYSDELLLEEDNVDLSCITSEFNRGVQINQAPISVDTSGGIGRHGHDARTSSNIEGQRTNESTQGFPQVEMGSPPSVYNLHAGYGHSLPKASPFLPHVTQNSPSRLGQQYGQQFHHWRPSAIHGNDGTHIKWQPSPFGFSSGGPHSPRSSSFSNGTSWGRRTNYPLADIPPPSRGRKDYGRIV